MNKINQELYEDDNMLLLHGDCLEKMKEIKDKSVDFIFTDLPYGTTKNQWDNRIALDKLWEQYERIIKDHGCIALWAQSPFDKILCCSNLPLYRYEWIIEKTKGTGFLNSKKMPLKCHESVQIFYKHLPTYHPQMSVGHTPVHSYTKKGGDGNCYGQTKEVSGGGQTERYPRDILNFSWDTQKSKLNATQKPLSACEYFIKTYTSIGDVVLDSCMGSGTTGKAAIKTGRYFIGIELFENMYTIAKERLLDNTQN